MIVNVLPLFFSGSSYQLYILVLDTIISALNNLAVCIYINKFGVGQVINLNFTHYLFDFLFIEIEFHCRFKRLKWFDWNFIWTCLIACFNCFFWKKCDVSIEFFKNLVVSGFINWVFLESFFFEFFFWFNKFNISIFKLESGNDGLEDFLG